MDKKYPDLAPGHTLVSKVERTSKAGIVLAGSQEEDDRGRILAVGPNLHQNGIEIESESRKHLGRACVFSTAFPVTINDTKYLIVAEDKFLAFFD